MLNRLGGVSDINNTRNALIENPNVVYIRTTPQQDTLIFNAATNSYFNGGTYRLCTNNCADAVQNIAGAGGVRLPVNIDPRPNVYFEKIKSYYPNNLTNESYR